MEPLQMKELFDQLAELKENEFSKVKKQMLDEMKLKSGMMFEKPSKKDIKQANLCKSQGNEMHGYRDYYGALSFYETGIATCPMDTVAAKELMTILVANRSACHMDLGLFHKVLADISFVLELKQYPRHLMWKIWERKAKCHNMINEKDEARACYNKAIECVRDARFEEDKLRRKLAKLRRYRNSVSPEYSVHIYSPPKVEDSVVPHKKYKALSEMTSVVHDPKQGRNVIATTEIPVGTTILVEEAHGAVLMPHNWLRNCQYCSRSIHSIVPCRSCKTVGFCSLKCEKMAHKTFHRYECQILFSLQIQEYPMNAYLALRMITNKHINALQDKYKKYTALIKDDNTQQFAKKKQYVGEDYDMVLCLCRNENSVPKHQENHWAMLACCMVRYLKMTTFFGPEPRDDKVLMEDEIYVGALMLRHFQILEFNIHDLAELRNVDPPVIVRNMKTYYENTDIGVALYPTLALFNHSCDPTVVRYQKNNKVVVKTIKPLSIGDQICENYGPLYMNEARADRQQYLEQKYKFKCECEPCTYHWPLFDKMDREIIKIKCYNCPREYKLRTGDDPIMQCDTCFCMLPLCQQVKEISPTHEILTNAEQLYAAGKFAEAIEKYHEAFDLLYRNTVSPSAEMVMVQHRLRTCHVHQGNVQSKYVLLLGTE